MILWNDDERGKEEGKEDGEVNIIESVQEVLNSYQLLHDSSKIEKCLESDEWKYKSPIERITY